MPGRRRSSVSVGSSGSNSSIKYKLIDPEGRYKVVKKAIADDCVRQKCLISINGRGDDKAEEFNCFGSRITVNLVNHSFTDDCSSDTVHEQFPGITEMILHVSEIPTMSVLLVKTETPSGSRDKVDLQYHCSSVDLNGIDPAVFQGLSTRNSFKLYFHKFVAATSEFSFDVILLGAAILDEHTVAEIPKKSKLIVQALEYIFQVNSKGKDDSLARDKRKREDIDWFYGQLKKFHETEGLCRSSVSLQHPHIIPKLREYQKDAVNWMMYRESDFAGEPDLIEIVLSKMYVEVLLKRTYNDEEGTIGYFNQFAGYLCRRRPSLPPLPTGGILADEMGLGKTVEVLSLIMLNPKPLAEDELDTKPPLSYPEMRHKRGTSPCEFRTKEAPLEEVTPQKRKLAEDAYDPDLFDRKHFKSEPVEEMEVDEEIKNKERDDEWNENKRRSRKKGKKRLQPRKKSKGSLKTQKRRGAKTQDQVVPSKKEKLYDRVRLLYDSALGQLSGTKHAVVSRKFHGEFFNPHVGRKAYFECICGEGLEDESDNVVTCVTCSSSQHKTCVGYDDTLVCATDSSEYICPHCAVQMPPIPTKTTLIVTPNTIARQWINEIRRHVAKEHMKILFYKGTAVHGYVSPQQLAQYDLIITTYGVLASELDYVDLPHSNSADGRRFRNPKRFLTIPSALPCILFWRICLDEAQMVEGISTRMASMALKLHGVHNWCVTGTPLNKGLEDLYGLFLFLGITPVSDSFWWYALVTNPFYQKDSSLLCELFGRLIWRNGKRDVLDQLGIPPQSQIVHWLDFSPVEAHFYKRLYENCGSRVLEKVHKICQHSHEGLTTRLSSLDRKALHELLAPFLELRQACCHPQLVNHLLSLKNVNETITMEEVLKQLIQKTKLKCAESHRALIGALNGAAGIHWILDEHVFASDKYREILQFATKHEKLFKTDTLQMLHTLENLADLLDMNCPGVPFTLRDDTLRHDAEALRAKYLENHAAGVKQAYDVSQKVTETVDELAADFQLTESSWWSEVLYEAMKKDKINDLMNRIKDSLSVYASKKDAVKKFEGPASFQKVMIEWITQVETLRGNVLDNIEELLGHDPSSFVESSVTCHLRKHGGAAPTHDFRCRLCVNLEQFSEYQHALFSEDLGNVKNKVARTGRNRQKLKITGNVDTLSAEEERLAVLREEKELIENTGHVDLYQSNDDRKMLKDSDAEKALRQLISFGRIHKLPEEILADGGTHIKLFDALKREFKFLRVLWTRIFDQVSAIDELSQATTRIALRPNSNQVPSSSSTNPPRVLANRELERARRMQEINLISYVELQPRLDDLKQEYEAAKADLNVHHGQLLYLEQLEKKNQGSKTVYNEEDCPVCHTTLGTTWSVLVCGHSYCSECMKQICHHPAHSFSCPLCRHTMKMSDVSFVDISVQPQNQETPSGGLNPTSNDEPQPSTSSVVSYLAPPPVETRVVRGSHSTKVQAVVEQLLLLQSSHPGEKVIIFSSWTGVLEIIGRALEQNGILFAGLKCGESKGNFQKTLSRFQERADIQVLLLPLTSGSKGLNIIEATHVFLVEPILNMASEHQAIGRVHRIGQTKSTFVHRFYVRNTIEEHLFEVLKSHDVCGDEEGMLSLGDLKELVTK